MQITSTRRQFIADHSSTNYFFYAAKPLSQKAEAYVNTLSSHVDVTSQTAQITYNGEFADLGGERRKKFLEHYDVEVRKSYDWWTLSVMLEAEKLPKIDLKKFAVQEEASLQAICRRGVWPAAPWANDSSLSNGTAMFTPVRICTKNGSKRAIC